MLSLKSSLMWLLMLSILGCQTSRGYRIQTLNFERTEFQIVQLESSRIRQKCLFYNAEGDNNWRHQYFMYILNDKKEVLEVMHPFEQDRETCESQVKKIEKVLGLDGEVRLCLRDKLKKAVINNEHPQETIEFGSLGRHPVSYEILTLDSVCNSNRCFSNNDIWMNTCPGFVKHEPSK